LTSKLYGVRFYCFHGERGTYTKPALFQEVVLIQNPWLLLQYMQTRATRTRTSINVSVAGNVCWH